MDTTDYQSTDLVKAPRQSQALLEQCEYTPTRLLIPEGLEFSEWLLLMEQVRAVQQSSMWWLGDVLLYGERHYTNYSQAAATTGYAPSTLQVAVYVAAKIEPERRRHTLGWSHHLEVVRLKPEQQDQLLSLAITERLTTEEVRHRARAIQTAEAYKDENPDNIPAHLALAEWRDHAAALTRFATKYPTYETEILTFTTSMHTLLRQALLTQPVGVDTNETTTGGIGDTE